MLKRSLYLVVLMIAVLGVACSEDPPTLQPIDAQTATLQFNNHFRTHAEGFAQSLLFLEESDMALGIVEAMGISGDDVSTCEPGGNCIDPEPATVDMTAEMTEVADFVESHIFVEANVEEDAATQVTYLMKPDVLCLDDESNDVDADCADFFTKVEIRLVASTYGEDNLEVGILVGPNRLAPIELEIYKDHIAVDVDLEQAKLTVEHIMSAIEEPGDEMPTLPQVMTGKLRVEAVRGANADYKVALKVLEDINVEATGTFPVDIKASVAKSDVAAVHFNSQGKILEAALNAGAISLELDGELGGSEASCHSEPGGEVTCTEEPGWTAKLGIELAGITGTAALDVAQNAINLTGMGLGNSTSSASIDGNTIVSVDINADHGRTFDATLAETADNGVAITLDPALQLQAALALMHIQDKLDGDVPGWAMDETLGLVVDGAQPALEILNLDVFDGGGEEPPVVCAPNEPCDPLPEPEPTSEAMLKLTSGNIVLSASSLTEDVTLEAGQCLLANEGAEGDHLFSMLSGGACP